MERQLLRVFLRELAKHWKINNFSTICRLGRWKGLWNTFIKKRQDSEFWVRVAKEWLFLGFGRWISQQNACSTSMRIWVQIPSPHIEVSGTYLESQNWVDRDRRIATMCTSSSLVKLWTPDSVTDSISKNKVEWLKAPSPDWRCQESTGRQRFWKDCPLIFLGCVKGVVRC